MKSKNLFFPLILLLGIIFSFGSSATATELGCFNLRPAGEPQFCFFQDGVGSIRVYPMANLKGNEFTWTKKGDKVTIVISQGIYYPSVDSDFPEPHKIPAVYKNGTKMVFTLVNAKTLKGKIGTLTQ